MVAAKKSSPWVWISLGLIIALFVAFVLFLDQKIVKSGRQSVATENEQDNVSKPIFDFYTVLPEREVDIPEPDVIENKPNTPKKNRQLASDAQYVLQAGSFRKQRDAERRKAELAFIGLESIVKQARVNGVIYHRVEMGPFVDDGHFSQVKNRLIENDIDYIPKSFN